MPAQPGPEVPAGAVIAAMVAAIVFGIIINVAIMGGIAYMLYLCFNRIPQPYRQLEPKQTFLLMIPCFNLVWNFFVFPKLAKSYQAYFQSVGRTDVGDCGEKMGLWVAISYACAIIPLIQYIAGPAALILLIIYLIKAFELRKQIPEQVVSPA